MDCRSIVNRCHKAVHLGRRLAYVLTALFLLQGCASLPIPPFSGFVCDMAHNDSNDSAQDGKIHQPAWLLLLPISIPADVVIFPFLCLEYLVDRGG